MLLRKYSISVYFFFKFDVSSNSLQKKSLIQMSMDLLLFKSQNFYGTGTAYGTD